MNIADFDFNLPTESIAVNPLEPRDSCKLMCLNRAELSIRHKIFSDLYDLLNPGDVLVLNNSKVIPARIIFRFNNKSVEIFLIRKINQTSWMIIGKPGKLLKSGSEFNINESLSFTVKQVLADGQRLVEFSLAGEVLDRALKSIGVAPFPPYIKNSSATLNDYQTIFASVEGSVAAPTAGLHFTDNLLERLKSKGVMVEFVTLHVGLGTFLPVKTDVVENHQMHKEYYNVDLETADRLNKAKREGRKIIAVGTTSVRVLESNFRNGCFTAGLGETDIYIYPGYTWKCVDAIITNFHLPKSTLLLLVSSFAGKEFVLKAYNDAIENKYRFYSFGDAMLIV